MVTSKYNISNGEKSEKMLKESYDQMKKVFN